MAINNIPAPSGEAGGTGGGGADPGGGAAAGEPTGARAPAVMYCKEATLQNYNATVIQMINLNS